MAFGELGIAKQIMTNAPKYSAIIEPFGDSGSVAFYQKKKKPKAHYVNYEDLELFTIMSFIQNISTSEKSSLKAKNWTGTPEQFDLVQKINATDGVDFFYRFFYMKKFTMKTLDKEAPPTFDYLKFGKDVKSLTYDLPIQKIALKGVILSNDVPDVLVTKGGSSDFTILVPKGVEQIDMVKSKISSVSGQFYYAVKSKNNDELFQAVADSPDLKTSTFAASAIMMAQYQIQTNYVNRIKPIDLEAINYGTNNSK